MSRTNFKIILTAFGVFSDRTGTVISTFSLCSFTPEMYLNSLMNISDDGLFFQFFFDIISIIFCRKFPSSPSSSASSTG